MKEKPVLPLLVSMALPNVISMLVNSLYNIVDSLFVARISEDAMTALSLVFPIQNFANAIAIGFGIGINAMIALYLGAGDRKKAETAATHGMALSLMHGILITILSIAIMPGFLRRFTGDESLISSGITYSTIVFLFATINMAGLAFEKMFQAVGRMKVTMAALIFGCVCNILLDPVLIFGLGPVPAMGIAGAALATGIGQLLSLCVYLFVYARTGCHDGCAHNEGELIKLFHTGVLPGTVVVTNERAHALHNAVGGQVQEGLQLIRDHCHRPDCPAHHLSGFCGFCRLHHLLRRVGGPWQRHRIADHFAVPLSSFHYAAGRCAVPFSGCKRRMACLLDHRSALCAGGLPGVPPGSWKVLSFPESAERRRQSQTNVHSTRESRKGSSFFFAIFI